MKGTSLTDDLDGLKSEVAKCVRRAKMFPAFFGVKEKCYELGFWMVGGVEESLVVIQQFANRFVSLRLISSFEKPFQSSGRSQLCHVNGILRVHSLLGNGNREKIE